MLFMIGVLALAAAIAVFALPIVLVALVIRASTAHRRHRMGDVPTESLAQPTFEDIIAREWPA